MAKYNASVDLSLLQHWVQGSLLLTTINNSSRIIFYANKIFTMISLHIKDLCVIKLFMARKQWVKSTQLPSIVRRNCRCISGRVSGRVWTFDHYSVSMQYKKDPPAYLVIFSHITHSWLIRHYKEWAPNNPIEEGLHLRVINIVTLLLTGHSMSDKNQQGLSTWAWRV